MEEVWSKVPFSLLSLIAITTSNIWIQANYLALCTAKTLFVHLKDPVSACKFALNVKRLLAFSIFSRTLKITHLSF